MLLKTLPKREIIFSLFILGLFSTAKAQVTDFTKNLFKQIPIKLENGDTVKVDYAKIQVPENRSNAESRSIPLVFLRLKNRTNSPSNPIVYLAGGPGGAGTHALVGKRWEVFNRLRNVGDVIILDQRGTGLSDELPRCHSSVKIPPHKAMTRTRYTRLHQKAMEECLYFWKNKSVDIHGYTTRESAADINAMRKAMGVKKINLFGISYGTTLALATLKYYPDHIDRLVLASAEGLNQAVKLPARTDRYIERLQKAIDEDSVAQAQYPDVRGLIEEVLDEVEANPPTLHIPEGSNNPAFDHTPGRFELQLITGYQFSDPENVSSILEGYADAIKGDFSWFRRYFDYNYEGGKIEFGGMSEAMDISSGITKERLNRVERQTKTALLGDALNFPMPHLRSAIPGITLNEEFREPVHSERPALFLSGTLDGRTYPKSHAEIADGFSNSGIVTIKNAGHNLFFSHPDVINLITDFFSGTPPKDQLLVAPLPDFRAD